MERMNQTLVLMMSFHLRDGQQAHRRYQPLRRSSTCAAALLSLQLPLAAMTEGFDALRGSHLRRKPLVLEPYIADTDDRNQEFRCQVRREQPFRSTPDFIIFVPTSLQPGLFRDTLPPLLPKPFP